MKSKFVEYLKNSHIVIIFLVLALVAESITAIIVSMMSFLFHGRVGYDFLITGAIAAFVATIGVTTIAFMLLQELKSKNKQLKEMDQLKSMFIASMSHELRTPLNTIIGFTGITLEGMSGDINDKQRDNLNRVKLAGQHLLSLISDVIDISKIEAGRVEAAVETFSLRELIRKSKEEIEAVATPKGLSVAFEMGEDIQMQSDRRRLYQCLLNFLSNAVKFTDQSGTILIRVEDAGEKVKISITDNGIGIAQEDQTKLFEAFERVETHMRVKPGGTGLGLYLTRKITEELLQGSVWVESTVGKGSTFGVTIPKTINTKISDTA